MPKNLFRYFKTSRHTIRLAVMIYVRSPLSLRNVEDLLHERGIDAYHESARLWAYIREKIRARRVSYLQQHILWQWHFDEIHGRINGVQHYRWRAADHEGGVLESYVTRKRDKLAALRSLKKSMKNQPQTLSTLAK